jgi:FtsP/CotA-like multicopper oxidase with cupredoxin domain
MTVSDWYHDQMTVLIPKFMSKANPSGAEPVPQAALLNDTQDLKIPVKPGKTYLFRVVNMAAFAGQYLWFEGHNMSIVEVDGVYTQPAEATMIYLAAAQRCSFLLTTSNETTGNFAFVASMDTVRIYVLLSSQGSELTVPRIYLTFCRPTSTTTSRGGLHTTTPSPSPTRLSSTSWRRSMT